MRAADLGSDIKEVLYTEEQVHQRVVELAAQIDADYAGRELLLVGVLNGAVMVMADLSRAMKNHVTMDWMAISSYGSGTQSSGVVRILKDLNTDISGMVHRDRKLLTGDSPLAGNALGKLAAEALLEEVAAG